MSVDTPARILDAAASTASSAVLDTTRFSVIAFRVQTTGFTGTLAFNGQFTGDEWLPARYHRFTPDDGPVIGGAATATLVLVADTSERIYYCEGPWAAMQAVMTRAGGTITVDWFGSDDPALISALAAAAGAGGSSSVTIVDGNGTAVVTPAGVVIQQPDPDALQATVRIVVGGEGEELSELNPLPVTSPDLQAVRIGEGLLWPAQVLSQLTDERYLQQGAFATGNGAEFDCAGMTGVIVQLTVSATATVTWEVLRQDGVWTAIIAPNITTGVTATTATATGAYWIPVAGFKKMRARVSTWVSGTVTALAAGYYGPSLFSVTFFAQALAGEDLTNDVIKVEERYSTSGVITADALIKTGAGFVHTVTMSSDAAATAGTFILYDNTSEAGTGTQVLLSVTFVAAFFPLVSVLLDVSFGTGLYGGFATTADVSVVISYR